MSGPYRDGTGIDEVRRVVGSAHARLNDHADCRAKDRKDLDDLAKRFDNHASAIVWTLAVLIALVMVVLLVHLVRQVESHAFQVRTRTIDCACIEDVLTSELQ